MSRIGRMPITVPAGVEITVDAENKVTVKGPKGTLTENLCPIMNIVTEGNTVTVVRPDDEQETRALHGLTRALLNNMVVGVTEGYSKKLEIVGVGYRVALVKTAVKLNIGFSHDVNIEAPEGITFEVPDTNTIIVKGIDKQLVGQTAAVIRGKRPPEPYHGKGIKYSDEYVRRKAGKTGK